MIVADSDDPEDEIVAGAVGVPATWTTRFDARLLADSAVTR